MLWTCLKLALTMPVKDIYYEPTAYKLSVARWWMRSPEHWPSGLLETVLNWINQTVSGTKTLLYSALVGHCQHNKTDEVKVIEIIYMFTCLMCNYCNTQDITITRIPDNPSINSNRFRICAPGEGWQGAVHLPSGSNIINVDSNFNRQSIASLNAGIKSMMSGDSWRGVLDVIGQLLEAK